MRKILLFLFCFVIMQSCTAIMGFENEVLNSLGKYQKRELYIEGEFQDYTDYGKYYFESADLSNNRFFTKIQETDLPRIDEHLDDFESWIETIKRNDAACELVMNYDFDREIIDLEDYIYIESETHTWDDGHVSLVRYNVYFFDTKSQILYYFHNNI